MADIVVKSNRLNTATQNLSLTEVRIMQLAIVDARETGQGLSTDKPLIISASRYAKAFNVSMPTAYEAILNAEKTLFDRRFSFLDVDDHIVKSRWVQRVKYLDDQASIEIILTYDVVNEITRIDGYEQFFTQYLLKQTASMKSVYSVRLYELLKQWQSAKKTPLFKLDVLKEQLGLSVDEYKLMSDFKKRVLNVAISEINEKSDLKVSYEQEKSGRKIIGFKFKILEKTKKKLCVNEAKENTLDIFTNMTDKQRKYFASKLSELPELSKFAKSGANYQQFAEQIADELKTENGIKKYKDYLVKVGFKRK